MKRLYIAEKREVANAMAEAFYGKPTKAQGGAFYTHEGIVTWLSGHLLELIEPEDIDPRYAKWRLEDLPIKWEAKLKPITRNKNHLAFVINLIEKAQELVNAGDPDPEGQRLVDAVIEYANATHKPCWRILINDNNPSAILKANDKLEPNRNYYGLSMSAFARAVADQHYGINMTRAFTLIAQEQGSQKVLSIGRVQTPILGLVVRRDHEYEAHHATPYYTIQAQIILEGSGSTTCNAIYQPAPTDPVDSEGRLNDSDFTQKLVDRITNAQAITVSGVTTKEKERPAPLPYNLLTLQAEASTRWGYSPKQVLEITQTLRDKYRAITYNRSDCRYLNDERHEDAPTLLNALILQYGLMATNVNPKQKSKAFNSNKVTAHHAIIPTVAVPNFTDLSAQEANIYDLITKLYIAQFYPAEQYRSTTVLFEVITQDGHKHTFRATSRVDLARGWLDLYDTQLPDDNTLDSDPEQTKNNLEGLTVGASATIHQTNYQESLTKPPARYTIATLLKDLTRTARYVKDPHIRKLLLDKDAAKQDEMGGIGTPATRDSMIETLFKRGFVIEQGKILTSTPLGRQFIACLPEFATTPDLTALWHEKQRQIETGEIDWKNLTSDVENTTREEINRLKTGVKLGLDKGHECPTCNKGYLQRRKSRYGYFWGCTCYPDCKASFPDQEGKVVFIETPEEQHKCPECASTLLRRQSQKTKNQYWWGCSNFPACSFKAIDIEGKPRFPPQVAA